MIKVKTLLLALAAGALAASTALGAPPPTHQGKGDKPPTTGTGCRPMVTVVLHGSVATAPGTSPVLPFGLAVKVTSANELGEAFVKTTQPVTVTVTSSTRIRNEGSPLLSSLLMGDRLTLRAPSCKAALANGATPALTATMLNAHPANS
jgi:hypothetical protein